MGPTALGFATSMDILALRRESFKKRRKRAISGAKDVVAHKREGWRATGKVRFWHKAHATRSIGPDEGC